MVARTIFEGLRRYIGRHNEHSGDDSEININFSIDTMRKGFYQAARALEKDMPKLGRVKDDELSLGDRSLTIRTYYPRDAAYALLPGLVFFGGGGFILGDLDSHDVICRRLCAEIGCVIIAVEYRKAPLHTFPSAHEDALKAWLEIHHKAQLFGIDSNRLAIAGDSAGGNLAVHISREMAIRMGPKPCFQLLYYPLLQFVDIRSAPLSLKQSGLSLSPALFEYFRDTYIPDETDRMDPRVSPLFADASSFRDMPPTHIVTSEWDPLTVEANVFADKLRRCGVDVSQAHYDKTMHGFLNLTAFVAKARTAIKESAAVVATRLIERVKIEEKY